MRGCCPILIGLKHTKLELVSTAGDLNNLSINSEGFSYSAKILKCCFYRIFWILCALFLSWLPPDVLKMMVTVGHRSVKYCFKEPLCLKPKCNRTHFFRVHLRTGSRAFLKLWHAHFSFSKSCEDREESSDCVKETCDSQMLLFLTQTACKPFRTSIWSSLGKTTSNQHFIDLTSMTYQPPRAPLLASDMKF